MASADWRMAVSAAIVGACSIATGALAADKFYAYNLTTSKDFTGVYLAPVGTQNWGSNEALNDNDKKLQRSERVLLTGIKHGHFDVRLVDEAGRSCIKHDVDLSHDKSFEVRDADVASCS